MRAKALESVSDATLAVFSSVFGHFRFNRRGRSSIRAEMRRNSDGRSLGWMSESRARHASPSLQTELEAAEMEWLELEFLREDLNG